MGYAYYVVNGKECGYAVEAVCEEPDCETKIDRGLAYACGDSPFEDNSCDGYFCAEHLFFNEYGPAVCRRCLIDLEALAKAGVARDD